MNRREILTAGVTAVAATAAATATAAANQAMNKGKEAIQPYQQPMEQKMKELEDRFDNLEHHHKNLIRVGGLAFALSTGIDLAVFL